MEGPSEKIEMGLNAKEDQITIVVGNETNSVQSVVVVKSNFSKKKLWNGSRLVSRFSKRSSSNLSNNSPQRAPRRGKLRSDLLRPESPESQRSSMIEGRRWLREQQPPSVRGRGPSRCEHSVTSQGSIYSHSSRQMHRVGRTPSLMTRSSRESRISNQHLRKDKSNATNRTASPPVVENNAYSHLKVMSKRRATSYRPRFRNNKVDPVVMMADVF